MNDEELLKEAEANWQTGISNVNAHFLRASMAASLLVIARNMDKLCNTQTIPPFKSPHNNS